MDNLYPFAHLEQFHVSVSRLEGWKVARRSGGMACKIRQIIVARLLTSRGVARKLETRDKEFFHVHVGPGSRWETQV